MGLKSYMTAVLIRRGKFTHRNTQRGECHMNTEGDWSDVCIRQGTPRVASNCQKAGERHGIDFLS